MNAATALQATCTTLAAPLQFSVPLDDLAEFAALPEARRVEVQTTLRLLERIHDLRGPGSLDTACATVAATSRHLMRGCSKQSLRRKYETFLGSIDEEHPSGNWRTQVAGYKGPCTLPAEFVQHARRLAEDNHRSMAEAWELLRLQWREGHQIPGYGTWVQHYMALYPERPLPKKWPRGFYPQGWSKRNLYRYAPSKGARTLALRGLAAAKRFFPSVKRDPSGLRPMEWIVIDDFELDCLCVFPGDGRTPAQISPVAGLLAKCVGTRRNLHWGIGARILREEKQKDGSVKQIRSGIRRVDVQVLLHDLFAKYGLPEYEVTIICENATAAISPELELSLQTLFEGRVKIERTNLIDHKTLGNGFTEHGGCPWEKGWVESAFNHLWNIMGNMPGYKGSNQRLNAPGDLDAKIAYTKLLLGQGERALNLPPEKIALLRLPFPSPEAVERAFAWAVAQQDQRTEHKYLGFERVTEFLLEEGGAPRPFNELALLPPSAQQQVITVQRPEAPIERWSRLAHATQFRPVPAAVLALLLLTPKRVTYRNHAVTFAHDKLGYTYVDEAGTVLRGVPEGTEFLGYFDPANPGELHLADLKGAYAGTLRRFGGHRGMVDARDQAAISEMAGVATTIRNRTLAEVRERHADQDAQLAQDKAHNDAIVAAHRAETAGLTTAQRIALAAGDNAAREHTRRQAEARAARPVSTAASSRGLADLAPEAGYRPEPDATTPEDDDAPASFADLTGPLNP